MPACVESMVYFDDTADGRKKPWHGLGVRVFEALTSKDAIVAAGLNWEVKQTPAFIKIDGQDIQTGDMVNYRVTDKTVLGTVSNRYKVVQNKEAFAFTDELLKGNNVHYETAGSLNSGRTVWLLAQMPGIRVLGDDIESFLLFSNSHDGSSCVHCNITNVRVVCQNTLNLALRTAQRSWFFPHIGNIETKIAEAKQTLLLAKEYNAAFKSHAEQLARKRVSGKEMKRIIDTLFPIPKDNIHTKTKLHNLIRLRENFERCYNADDLTDFRGTAWGVINAIADMSYHGGATLRKTQQYQEKGMFAVIKGNSLIDRVHSLLIAAA